MPGHFPSACPTISGSRQTPRTGWAWSSSSSSALRATAARSTRWFFVGPEAIEEKQVRGDRRVGGKDAVGQANNGVQVEFGQEFMLDPGTNAIAKQRAVGNDHPGPATLLRSFARPPQLPHDELQEQQGRFRSLLVGGEIGANPGLFLTAKGRIGQDHVHPVPLADLRQFPGQAVAVSDLRRSQPVQQQIHLGQHVGQRLGLTAEDALLLQDLQILDRLALLFQVAVRFDQETRRAAGRVENRLRQVGDR